MFVLSSSLRSRAGQQESYNHPMQRILIILALGFVTALAAEKAATDRWDKTFPGVVHDEKKIGGFVEEYRWLSNFFPCRVEWEGRVYGSAEAAYQSGKY